MSYEQENLFLPIQFAQTDANNALIQFAKAAIELENSVCDADNLGTPLTTVEEDELHIDPIYDAFVTNQSDPVSCVKKLTNFTVEQFSTLVDILSKTMSYTIHSERGRKSEETSKILPYMLLAVLKREREWSFTETIFKKRDSTFEKLMSHLIASTVNTLNEKFIVDVGDDTCTMEIILEKKKQFKHNPNALYATNVKFLHKNRPQGSQLESKLYFSGKHRSYGYKVEVVVSSLGFAVYNSRHYHGFKANISISI